MQVLGPSLVCHFGSSGVLGILSFCHAAHRFFHLGAVGGGSAALAARTSRRRSLGDQCGEPTELALRTVSVCGRALGACGPPAGRAGGFLPRLRLLDELVV